MSELTHLAPPTELPVLLAAADERARCRFLEFFAARIRNLNTRRAYASDIRTFLDWCDVHGVASFGAITPIHIGAYVETLMYARSVPTAKRHLAAIRHLFDWMVTGQIVPINPAASVRGPAHVVRRGKTPVLAPEEARAMLDAIDLTTLTGIRDRALIGLMVYSFARIGAALSMKVEDAYIQNRRLWVRLHEKGGKRHEMPCHHNLEAYMHAYIEAAGIQQDVKGPLFRTIRRGTGQLSETRMVQADAYAMIRRRAETAGIQTRVGNHSFRATGITAYLKNGGTLENAARMANHSSTRTTQLYDRRSDDVSLDEVERVLI